jgi:hypothetical protein
VRRPAWVRDVERTSSGALLVLERADGKLVGVRLSTRSLREAAEQERRR